MGDPSPCYYTREPHLHLSWVAGVWTVSQISNAGMRQIHSERFDLLDRQKLQLKPGESLGKFRCVALKALGEPVTIPAKLRELFLLGGVSTQLFRIHVHMPCRAAGLKH